MGSNVVLLPEIVDCNQLLVLFELNHKRRLLRNAISAVHQIFFAALDFDVVVRLDARSRLPLRADDTAWLNSLLVTWLAYVFLIFQSQIHPGLGEFHVRFHDNVECLRLR